jgi:circadian clock protein KaiC
VIDPLSAFGQVVAQPAAEQAAVQLLDAAKAAGVTALSTTLLGTKAPLAEETPLGVSTVADTWMHVSYVQQGGERNRALTIVKSRGMGHSNQVRELNLSARGVDLKDVYSAGGTVAMGTLRWQKENEERRQKETERRRTAQLARQARLSVAETQARVDALASELSLRRAELDELEQQQHEEARTQESEHRELLLLRRADRPGARPSKGQAR